MICAHCGADFNATGLPGRRKHCINCSPIRSRNLEVEAERKRNAYQHVTYDSRTCQREGCQATFTPKQKHQRYCTPRCQAMQGTQVYRRRHQHTATCKHCGEQFTCVPSNRQVYCSTECHRAAKAKRYRENPSPAQLAWLKGRPKKEHAPRTCKECGDTINSRSPYCDACRPPAWQPADRSPRPCPECGTEFEPPFRRGMIQVYCSAKCAGRVRRRRAKDRDRALYKERRKDPRKSNTVWAIASRDGWRCHICHRKVSLASATRDHITPLADGGTWDRDNLRLAHLKCNSRRGRGRLPAQLVIDHAA